jgi:hypothetical protein
LSAAATKMPLAVKGVPIQAHAGRFLRALVTPARAQLEGEARRSTVVGERGGRAGTAVWWLDPHGLTCVVPATEERAVPADARARAAARAGSTVGRRAHTVRQGQGREAWRARLETAMVGRAGLTTDDQAGTRAPGRPHHRRDGPPHPSPAGGVRTWQGRDDGPGGRPVFLTHASVPPCDDDEDRRRLEPCWLKATPQPWRLRQSPYNVGRSVQEVQRTAQVS